MYQRDCSYVCIKKMDVFYTFVNQPIRTIVLARCRSVNVSALSFKFGAKPENSKKQKA